MDKLTSIRLIKDFNKSGERIWKVKLKARGDFLIFPFNLKPNMDEVAIAYKNRANRDGVIEIRARILYK